MKEYCVKITEIRYEYIEAKSEEAAVIQAGQMALSNADYVVCEVVNDRGD